MLAVTKIIWALLCCPVASLLSFLRARKGDLSGMQRDVYKIKSQGLRPNTSGCQADPWGAPFSSKGSLCWLRLSSRNPPLQRSEYQQIRDTFGLCGWSRHPPGSFALVFLPFFFLRFAFLCWSAFVSWGSSMEQPAVPNANLNDAIFNW